MTKLRRTGLTATPQPPQIEAKRQVLTDAQNTQGPPEAAAITIKSDSSTTALQRSPQYMRRAFAEQGYHGPRCFYGITRQEVSLL